MTRDLAEARSEVPSLRWVRERTVRTTGDLVQCCLLVTADPALAYEFARRGAHAAELLGWWAEDHDVPPAAVAAAAPAPRTVIDRAEGCWRAGRLR